MWKMGQNKKKKLPQNEQTRHQTLERHQILAIGPPGWGFCENESGGMLATGGGVGGPVQPVF